MAINFKGAHFPPEVILMGIRWYVAYPLSTRHVEELMEERGVEVDHSTIKLTVSLGVTCAVVCTYGCDDGRIALTRCAIIDAGLDGRCRPRRTRRTLPAAARSGRNALAVGLRPASTADPGA